MHNFLPKISCSFFIILTVSSCQNAHVVNHLKLNVTSQYCAPNSSYAYDEEFVPLANSDSVLANSKELSKNMSSHNILMSNATGVLFLMNKMLIAKKDPSVQGRLNLLEISQRIQNHLLLLTTEISGIAAELDCEGERADLFANYLDNINDKRTARLTGASIVIGALATVAAVAVSNGSAQNAISISGGVVSAGLGILTIKPAGKKISYIHDRNVLQDIWFEPKKSSVYSPFIWYILTEKHFSNSQKEPLVQSIKARWKKFELDKKMDNSTIQLLFEKGGIYNADQLHTRATMLNQFQSTIRSINQDMQGFISTLNRINNEK
ncbi:hypothetical protein L0657_21080 [Dyadobacter sp. CY345]|uniref:hypothetical protein n=1 Tax=Dyadobacter sp. CY345 TaxID=2909335 RepID=UPI001F269BA4|nr:hypothetical protein [Dyadobacter sp. CY345]MCF2446465.1 hypothetical protein [Dyadobacter sp. CY345]